MPFITIDSPLAGRTAEIYYRQVGEGVCLCFLHGGWGYDVYSLERQRDAIQDFQVIIADRSGYGRSTKPAIFTIDFHRRAAEETLRCMDALDIRKCIFWGHSDGAVIAVWLGLMAPERCLGLILEALHYYRDKPGSRGFFETMVLAPESFGANVGRVLASEHGEPYWRQLMSSEGQVWLDIARSASTARRDLYEGRLSELTVPTLFIHGAQDPRTEPGELDAIRHELASQQAKCRPTEDRAPASCMHIIDNGGHSPHSEDAAAAECGRVVRQAMILWSAGK
jgi:pimeloyl-ACP methyl ester carboxylesterase